VQNLKLSLFSANLTICTYSLQNIYVSICGKSYHAVLAPSSDGRGVYGSISGLAPPAK